MAGGGNYFEDILLPSSLMVALVVVCTNPNKLARKDEYANTNLAMVRSKVLRTTRSS